VLLVCNFIIQQSFEKQKKIFFDLEFLDIVQSQPLADIPSENPAIFLSEKTGRGPLSLDWFEQMKKTSRKESIMCAYKLCRAEFRYWGMQSRCERFIHEIGNKK
jgi:hypothetical protein